MSKILKIQFAPFDRPSYYGDDPRLELREEDRVVVKTEYGHEVGKIIDIMDAVAVGDGKNESAVIDAINLVRKATVSDLEKLLSEDDKRRMMLSCKKIVERLKLEMKIVDTFQSFEGSRLTFAFIADGRIDFRELVKELTRTFNKTIRLQQIGIRDEAKLCGDYGHCGRKLCCIKFLNDLASITSEMAEAQQCVHRGSERLSGICGRLMCCLAYEEAGYRDMAKSFPPIGSVVKFEGKPATVLSHHLLKKTILVEMKEKDGYVRTEVELSKIKR